MADNKLKDSIKTNKTIDKLLAIIKSNKGRRVFVTGHSEYDADTLKFEYLRDISKGIDIEIPKNYFPNDDPQNMPIVKWRSHANILFSNWLNYCVYQVTPYVLENGQKRS